MPPPKKFTTLKKRRSKVPQEFAGGRRRQTIAHPKLAMSQGKLTIPEKEGVDDRPKSVVSHKNISTVPRTNDSDSDTACGFDATWRGPVQE